ncbi:MFS transporter [Methanocella sp. CWC-04]|uniref:MFS transporter n=1 Tax=Methanooceanicella nereidis TaxID=2052831 RepID=A0AAP2RDV5_9EURY|nr:MFS transporter [Methanocella sp. CWC-04]MCD1295297.1 MFS transporter [Methanocella sp. CWC-04]
MQQSVQMQEISQDTVYKNRYVILAVILIGVLMAVLDGFMISIALPTITMFFNVNVAQSQWVITGYLISMTCLFIVFGRVSEYTGKVKLFMTGFAIFTLSSLACGLASSIDQLIAFRIIQGIGASMVAGISGAMIYHAFPQNEIGRAMGYYMATVAIGSLIAPALGGFLVDSMGWQYIFFINIPIGVLLLALAFKYLKLPEMISKSLEIDWIGMGTLIVTVVSLMLLCSEFASSIRITTSSIIYSVIFAAALIIFTFQESRCKKPLLELSIFRNKRFTLPILSMMCVVAVFNIGAVIWPFYFQGVMGYTPSQVGLLFMVTPLVMMFAGPVSGKLYDKYQWKYTAGTGAFIAAIAFLLLGYAFMAIDLTFIIPAFIIWGIGYSLFTSPNNAEVLSSLPREKTAIASSVSSTARNLGSTLGISLASILLMFWLGMAGYNGVVLSAGQSLLANSISVIMIAGGVLCILGAVTSVLRNI